MSEETIEIDLHGETKQRLKRLDDSLSELYHRMDALEEAQRDVDSRVEHMENIIEESLESMHYRVDSLLSFIHSDKEKDTTDSSIAQVTQDEGFPLHKAARAGDIPAIKVLLKEGAAVQATDKDKESPIQIAAAQGHTEVVQLLLRHSYDNIKDELKFIEARHHLAQALCVAGNSNVAHLLIKKVGLHVKSAAMRFAARDGRVEVLRSLLEAGVGANEVDENGWSALHAAARAGHIDCLKLLLEFGAKSSYVAGMLLQTPLHVAADQGHAACLEMLIGKGRAHINFRDRDGSSALHLATCAVSPESVKVLLKHGVNVASSNKFGETSLHKAAYLSLSERICADDTAAVLARRKEILKMLLDAGADPNAKREDASTALDMDGAEALRQIMT